jgi:hypothetical protein
MPSRPKTESFGFKNSVRRLGTFHERNQARVGQRENALWTVWRLSAAVVSSIVFFQPQSDGEGG